MKYTTKQLYGKPLREFSNTEIVMNHFREKVEEAEKEYTKLHESGCKDSHLMNKIIDARDWNKARLNEFEEDLKVV